MTCRYRCGDACFHEVPNTSTNPYFGDVFAKALSRRGVLRAGALGAGASAFGIAALGAPASAGPGNGSSSKLKFHAIDPSTSDAVVVPKHYDHRVVVRWGDPVAADAPEFDFTGQTAQAQAKQFGYNCDYTAFFEIGDDRGLLWVNHEYTDEVLMFRGYTDGNDADLEQIKIAMAAHGGSIVEVERVSNTGAWQLADSGQRRYNRRITAQTTMKFTGPAAGDRLLRTEADPEGVQPRGMLNNCAGGYTPWGTVLTCEENFNQYFVGGNEAPEDAKPALRRYGIATDSRGEDGNRRFDRVEERFDLAKHPKEANRFGWVVEIDPFDPGYVPRKRTMLGRIKHEGANTLLTADGRVAVYMGDDERFDYMYKFVSDTAYREGSRRHNGKLLDSGTLYAARLTGDSPEGQIEGSGELPEDGAFDGQGEWLPLCDADRSYIDGFTVADVLVHTRLAADAAGATKMDRPEDFEASPVTGKVYCALTNNSDRTPGGADEPNPRGPNKFGHILEITEDGSDAGATGFSWTLPLVCGDPEDPATYFAGYDKRKVSAISCPDNLTFDAHGNLWISTDGQSGAAFGHDCLHAVVIEGKDRGRVKRFASMPTGAECCGPFITADQKTVFIAPQHPGEIDGATVDNPASTWPDGDFPRPSVVSIWHTGGKDIGR